MTTWTAVGKGVLSGLVAGAAATAVMSMTYRALSRAVPVAAIGEQEQADRMENAAEVAGRAVLERPLTPVERYLGGTAVHYAFGMSMGALYGGLAELLPAVTVGSGTAFGAAVMAVADEVAVPALELSPAPAEPHPSTHAQSLVGHLVYGATTELLRRAVRDRL
jgi:uncharacterized membrane protein YagU involved in acid resistance